MSCLSFLNFLGYLSDGCSHPVTINGGYGGDFFDILRNKCILDLNGEAGDDSFVVRSFIPVITETGELAYDIGQANLKGNSEECTNDPECDGGNGEHMNG